MKKKSNMSNKKVDLNNKIELDIDENLHGFIYGLMIGGVVGIVLTLIFKVDLGYMYGLAPGMAIGLLVDISKAKNNKKK